MLDLNKVKERIEALKKLPGIASKPISKVLEEHGFSRRDFLKWSGALAVTLGLPPVLCENYNNRED